MEGFTEPSSTHVSPKSTDLTTGGNFAEYGNVDNTYFNEYSDEFGHDGDAIGKMKNIEEIDQRFFKPLLENIDSSKVAIIISADHSTPCINKGHSDDPVPVLVSGDFIKNDGTTRMTEEQAKKGSIGLLQGADVVTTALNLIKSQI